MLERVVAILYFKIQIEPFELSYNNLSKPTQTHFLKIYHVDKQNQPSLNKKRACWHVSTSGYQTLSHILHIQMIWNGKKYRPNNILVSVYFVVFKLLHLLCAKRHSWWFQNIILSSMISLTPTFLSHTTLHYAKEYIFTKDDSCNCLLVIFYFLLIFSRKVFTFCMSFGADTTNYEDHKQKYSNKYTMLSFGNGC